MFVVKYFFPVGTAKLLTLSISRYSTGCNCISAHVTKKPVLCVCFLRPSHTKCRAIVGSSIVKRYTVSFTRYLYAGYSNFDSISCCCRRWWNAIWTEEGQEASHSMLDKRQCTSMATSLALASCEDVYRLLATMLRTIPCSHQPCSGCKNFIPPLSTVWCLITSGMFLGTNKC